MMKRKIFKFILVLLAGGIGGILAEMFILPYLITLPLFSQMDFLRQFRNGSVVINKTEKIYIAENQAAEQAIDAIGPRLAAVQTFRSGQMINEGSGFILTSDGWLATAGDLAPLNADKILVFRNGESFAVRDIRRDSKNNLALLKIEQINLPVVSLAELADVRLGEEVILVGGQKTKSGFYKFVNLGAVRSIHQETMEVNLREESSLANGGSLLNIKGEVLGLNLIDKKGLKKIIPASKVKEVFSELTK